MATDANVASSGKTKIIRNDSDSVVTVSYDETEAVTNSFSTSITKGLTLDMTVSSETTVSGTYAGVSAEEKVTAEFGAETSTEESREKSEEGTHEETISIDFDAAPHQYYLVTITKEHETTYTDFDIDGVMDFDVTLGLGGRHGGHAEHYYPGDTVKLTGGMDGFEQFVRGYDTDYPSMQGAYDHFYSRTTNGINCALDPNRRRITVSGTNQAQLEKNVDYRVQSLGGSIPDHLQHLPVEDADDLAGGGGGGRPGQEVPCRSRTASRSRATSSRASRRAMCS